MNRRQKLALWAGVVLFIAAGLFPPWVTQIKIGERPAISVRSVHFISGNAEEAQVGSVDIVRLTIEWIIVVVFSAALIATLNE